MRSRRALLIMNLSQLVLGLALCAAGFSGQLVRFGIYSRADQQAIGALGALLAIVSVVRAVRDRPSRVRDRLGKASSREDEPES